MKMSKYEWTNVPKDENWIATDEDGVSRGHEGEPVIDHPEEWHSDQFYNYKIIGVGLFSGDWKDSLEERPK